MQVAHIDASEGRMVPKHPSLFCMCEKYANTQHVVVVVLCAALLQMMCGD